MMDLWIQYLKKKFGGVKIADEKLNLNIKLNMGEIWYALLIINWKFNNSKIQNNESNMVNRNNKNK